MTTTNYAFTTDRPINDQYETFVSNFEADAPLLPIELRVMGVETLTEAYFNHVGKHAPMNLNMRLANTLMLTFEEQEELRKIEEEGGEEAPPITLNEEQLERREKKTVSDVATYASGVDGQSYAPPVNARRKGKLYE